MHEHRVRRKVEYVDTDMSGIVHFSRFLIYMENTEHAFLKAIGADVHFQDGEGRQISWPRVAVSCDYQAPARFGDELEIHLRVIRKGTRSLTYGFEVTRGGEMLAKGRSTCACCVMDDPAGIKAIPIPRAIAERIEEAHHREGD
jgi:YbgC/YbaW family acyl-CoA thioester hydrolase